jgi:RNA polymerase sigma-70 factor (ECF subfamily)
MTDIPTPSTPGAVPIEALLAHRDWVRALARSLVRDESSADDVEQRTWQVALESPPTKLAAARAWLGSVVRRTVLESQRKHVRRERRELAVARPEGVASTADVVARIEIDRAVVSSVAELEEPYRTTLLLRFYDGLPPRAVAERMGVPVETVRTRVRRGLERVRERLDRRHGGDRDAWMGALVPFLAGPGGGSSADAAPAGGAPGLSIGAVAAAVLAIGLGFLGGRELATRRTAGEEPGAALTAASERLQEARADRDAAWSDRDALRRAVAEREATLAERTSTAGMTANAEPTQPAPATDERAPFASPFTFPAFVEALERVDWNELGALLADMIPMLGDLHETRAAERMPSAEVVGKMQTFNGRITEMVLPLEPSFPGGATNKSLTHPTFTATMIAALCHVSDRPLTPEQVTAIDRLAQDASLAVDRATDGSAQFRLEALLEESGAKLRFASEMRDVLRPEQHALLGTDAMRSVVGYDLFGPAQMWPGSVEMGGFADIRDAAPIITRGMSSKFGVDPAELRPVVDAWLDSLPEDELAQVPSPHARRDDAYALGDVEAAARHMLDLMRRIDALELSDAARQAVRNSKQVLILRRAP